jgi:hypothetical protein
VAAAKQDRASTPAFDLDYENTCIGVDDDKVWVAAPDNWFVEDEDFRRQVL